MAIPANFPKCTVFLAVKNLTEDSYKYVGSAFYVGISAGPGMFTYLVTARHVIDGVRSLGATEIHIRVNFKDKTSGWTSVPLTKWGFHPTDANVDVSALAFPLHPDWDHLAIPENAFMTKEKAAARHMGLGDEVFITGLFKFHEGKTRNIPICRMGNLAALDDEKLTRKNMEPLMHIS